MRTPIDTTKSDRVCQGDIIKNVGCVEYIIQREKIVVSDIKFPNIIVLTQDCDLLQDFTNRRNVSSCKEPSEKEKLNNDKYLVSAIVAPLYNYEHFREGTHLSELGLTMQKIFSKLKDPIENNTNPRYHFMDFGDANPYGLVKSVVDFKHYFSVNIEYLTTLKKTNFIGKVVELHRENISHRFAAFLSRIGLPT